MRTTAAKTIIIEGDPATVDTAPVKIDPIGTVACNAPRAAPCFETNSWVERSEARGPGSEEGME